MIWGVKWVKALIRKISGLDENNSIYSYILRFLTGEKQSQKNT